MMKRYILILISLFAVLSAVDAQAPLTAYHSDSFILRHRLNPAFTPEYDHISLPLLGCTSLSLESSMGMGSLIFDRPDGTLSLFTSSGTISKDELMKKVGGGLNFGAEAAATLISYGRHASEDCYRTLDVTLHAAADAHVDRSVFDMVKEVENRSYTLGNTGLSASSWLDISVGEADRIDEHWTIGGRLKFLIGLMNADLRLNRMNLNLLNAQGSAPAWTADGDVSMAVAGFDYTKEYKTYQSRPGGYTQVKGISRGGLGIRGFGIGTDLGVAYRMDDRWTFSASLLDLGFITWYGSRKAVSNSSHFVFDGFQNLSADDADPNGFKNQWNRLKDDIADLMRLEEVEKTARTNMLNMTFALGATCQLQPVTLGGLFTTRTHYGFSDIEWRLSAEVAPFSDWNFALSPAFVIYDNPRTQRFALGAMVSYHPGRYNFYIASDNLFFRVNRQLIPTSLNGGIMFGAAMYL